MDSTTRNMINSLTEDILQLLHVRTPIENMDELVCSLGGRIEEDIRYSDGAVQKDGDAFIIWVSPLQDEKRRRFTIAHELGHLFLHMGYLTNHELWEKQENKVYQRIGNSEKEYQANEFAAAFLMPKKEYFRVMEKSKKRRSVEMFFSFDIVNSSSYKTLNFTGWLQVIITLFARIQERVAKKIPSAEMWKILGDEVIFIVPVLEKKYVKYGVLLAEGKSYRLKKMRAADRA